MRNLSKRKGKDYWRSLDQLADSPEFKELLSREFPEGASEMKDTLTRRNFLTLMGASMALAGLTACRRPVEKIVPYVKAPEERIPGIPEHYATTMPLGTSVYGVVVESHEGRPTKVEGNHLHPSTLGRSNTWMQASVLDLYDPDRSQRPVQNGTEKSWADFVAFWNSLYAQYQQNKGKGLAVLVESYSSPTMARLKAEFVKRFPQGSWTCYAPVNQENIYRGIELATGKVYHPDYHPEKAGVILSLDADFLLTENDNVKNINGFAAGRKINSVQDRMNRLYVVEPSYSATGGMADHRLKLNHSQMTAFVLALLNTLKNHGLNLPFTTNPDIEQSSLFDQKWIDALAKDLMENRTRSLILVGRRQPPVLHTLVYVLNEALGNIGHTVTYRNPIDLEDSSLTGLTALARSIKNGQVETLIILGGNPVYNSPADLEFNQLLTQVKNSIHLSAAKDETSQQVSWHIPLSHYLESWGDARSADGTLSLIQPLIAPLFDSHSMIELLYLINHGEEKSGYQLVRQTWESILPKAGWEEHWRRILHDGVQSGSQMSQLNPSIDRISVQRAVAGETNQSQIPGIESLEVIFQASPAVYDGRYANNGWLQELPDTVTKLTWDNAALLSPATAKALALENEDLIILTFETRELLMPVWILPGMADYCVALPLGYGRTASGRIGDDTGFNTYKLRTVPTFDSGQGLTIRKINDTYSLSSTQDHSSMEGRPLVREATIGEYREKPEFAGEMVEHPPLVSLWEEHAYDKGYQWGMSIDLNACTGCNACTIACQSENNIPIVGKKQVKNGREMHWIRIDRYFSGSLDNPQMVYQPVGCQHCEMAPCEQVCPVAATVHDAEGLNQMTYNRCVGTRYCSNNCPYKVRRFNFFNYTNQYPETIKMVQNPDVTVRSRGVMEKCTYCLQRINEAKISAKNEGREVADGEIQTACQQACPADAIVFGNIRDPESAVSEAKKNNRRYEMLGELNLKPRASYLARLRNPNSDIEER